MADVRGLDELLRNLKRIPDTVSPRGGGPLERAMRKGTRVWVDEAKKNLAGRGPGTKNSRTGNVRLINSIVARKDSDPEANNFDVRFEVGYKSAAFWGEFVERGTEKQDAEPFLRPAFDSSRDEILKVITDRLRLDIERAVR